MTFPANGSDPFDYSDDTVAARLAVDVPADAEANLQGVVQRTAELRVEAEAIARAYGTTADYLRDIPTLMEGASEASSRFQNAIVISSGGNPNIPLSGRNNPLAASAANSGTGRGEGRGGTMSATDVVEQLQELEDTDPRQARNMRAQRNAGTRPGAPARPGSGRPPRRNDAAPSTSDEPDPENHSGRPSPDHRTSAPQASVDYIARGQSIANQGQNFINQVLQETRQGQTGLGNANAAIRGVRYGTTAAQTALDNIARARYEAEGGLEGGFRGAAQSGGRLGALAGGLGTVARVAGAAGIAYTAATATQGIGEQYQTYKNQGLIRGEGAAAGLGYEAQIRSMALNPFINTEQARKIVNSALTEGYTGKEMDNVTDFMAENLKNMNLSVADSVKLLNTNVVEGGQSLQQLNTQLNTMKDLSGSGYATLQDRQQIFAQVSGQAIANGATGEASGDLGNLAGDLFSDNKILAGIGGDLASSLQSNPNAQRGIRDANPELSGVAPDQLITGALDVNGGDAGGVLKAGLRGIQDAFNRQIRPMYERATDTRTTLLAERQAKLFFENNGFGKPLSVPKVRELVKLAMAGKLESEASSSIDRTTESEERVTDTREGRMPVIGQTLSDIRDSGLSLGGGLKTIGAALNDVPGFLGSFIGFGDSDFSDTVDTYQKADRQAENRAARYKNERLQGLVEQYGSGAIKVEGGDGIGGDLDQNNKAQVEAIAKGDAKISINGGEAMTLGEAQAQAGGLNGGGGSIEIGLTAQAQKLVTAMDTSNRNNTQMNADAGVAGARYSNQTPAEMAPR